MHSLFPLISLLWSGTICFCLKGESWSLVEGNIAPDILWMGLAQNTGRLYTEYSLFTIHSKTGADANLRWNNFSCRFFIVVHVSSLHNQKLKFYRLQYTEFMQRSSMFIFSASSNTFCIPYITSPCDGNILFPYCRLLAHLRSESRSGRSSKLGLWGPILWPTSISDFP